MKRPFQSLVVLPALAVWIVGCSRTEAPVEGDRSLAVFATFYPTTYFAERIGGSRIHVVCPVPDGADPSLWMPDAPTIEAFQTADLIVVNGADFEKWLAKVSLPRSILVDTTAPLRSRLLRFEKAITHSHGPAGQHSHEGTDGHTWLDPQNAIVQAGEIYKALAKLLPAHATELAANRDRLETDLHALDASLKEVTTSLQGQPLLASHPAYNYLAKRYGWNLVNLSLDPEQAPTEETIGKIREILKTKHARIVLWESEPRREVAGVFQKEFGLKSVVFSPCESPPPGEDYLAVMRRNVENLQRAQR